MMQHILACKLHQRITSPETSEKSSALLMSGRRKSRLGRPCLFPTELQQMSRTAIRLASDSTVSGKGTKHITMVILIVVKSTQVCYPPLH